MLMQLNAVAVRGVVGALIDKPSTLFIRHRACESIDFSQPRLRKTCIYGTLWKLFYAEPICLSDFLLEHQSTSSALDHIRHSKSRH